MIKSVNNYPVSQLFDTESNVIYAIPRYQREYTWNKSQWESLFDDILENDPGYFLGSMICINQTADTLSLQQLEVVDGQQRLTTLSLLFAAIYHALQHNRQHLDDEQRLELINLRRRLVLKKGEDQMRVTPQIQNNNLLDYRAVLAEIAVIQPVAIPPYAGNRRVFRAFRYFQERISTMTEDPGQLHAILAPLLEKVSQSCMVKIEVASHADAYTLFESLNNRGIPLSAIDLIKNRLLATLDSIDPGRIDHYFEQWNRLLGYLGDDYATQERFFRQYYNAFREELKDIYQVPVATRSNLIQIYEKLIDNDAQACLKKVTAAAQQYKLFLPQNQEDSWQERHNPLKRLERIQGTPSYLLLLYLYMRQTQLKLSTAHLAEISSLLVRFFVRRNLTDTPPTRDLIRFFMAIITKLSGKEGVDVIATVRRELLAVSASDEVFRQRLLGPLYGENSGATRFILCSLAEQAMTKENWVDLWRVDKRQYVWTIEHVFPQGDNIPPSWVDMIADGDREQARRYQQEYVHKLGNLTVSGFNSALGNKSFAEKRDRVDRGGRPVGYKNGLSLNQDLAVADSWSVEKIDARTDKLVDQAMAIFRLDDGRP